jgi:hypothetical protein
MSDKLILGYNLTISSMHMIGSCFFTQLTIYKIKEIVYTKRVGLRVTKSGLEHTYYRIRIIT